MILQFLDLCFMLLRPTEEYHRHKIQSLEVRDYDYPRLSLDNLTEPDFNSIINQQFEQRGKDADHCHNQNTNAKPLNNNKDR